MALRQLTADRVAFRLTYEKDDLPVRGNAQVSGDDNDDRQVEDEILARLDRGEAYAWCVLKVEACWGGFVGSATLSAVSVAEEKDLEVEAEDLKAEALDDLNEQIAKTHRVLETLREKEVIDGS
jgi:hypothetical protein